MSTYEKVVIVVIRFVAVLWFVYSLTAFASMTLSGLNQLGIRLTPVFLISFLAPLALYFAARLLARIITAGVD
ncbi:hypothetical protein TSACC_23220 [Terrimicrobium sacchariphilum]|jgi:hypothetical protein|uniref:Uncharacterized protein n=1 Tax=Terrimicrobium sacchariphilum TaxID=690879 RepID=A0A146GE62_TERSA|nr:hypothetical protein [Terrimicrobium sacchariphilum]GAT34786.1 hypothetical protein TSACC_23220 [Terrimicrobium sacchariphilum]